jgi:hypothetical protein
MSLINGTPAGIINSIAQSDPNAAPPSGAGILNSPVASVTRPPNGGLINSASPSRPRC